MGSCIPWELTMEDEAIHQKVLANLNVRHCFDFDYKPRAKDRLAIAIDAARTRWAFYVYKNKKWVTDDTGQFEDWKQKLEALNHGIIESD